MINQQGIGWRQWAGQYRTHRTSGLAWHHIGNCRQNEYILGSVSLIDAQAAMPLVRQPAAAGRIGDLDQMGRPVMCFKGIRGQIGAEEEFVGDLRGDDQHSGESNNCFCH